MSARRWWKIMAVTGPALALLVVLAFTAWRAFLFQVVTCQLHVPSGVQVAALLVMTVMSVAITLTFVTAALRSPEHGWFVRVFWVLVLLFASPLGVPAYWFVHLRHADDAD